MRGTKEGNNQQAVEKKPTMTTKDELQIKISI